VVHYLLLDRAARARVRPPAPGYRGRRGPRPRPLSRPGNRATCDVSELGTCVQLTARGALDAASVSVLREAARRVDLCPAEEVRIVEDGESAA
jgi:hypothetical protein